LDFAHSFQNIFSNETKLVIYSKKFVIEGVGVDFLTDLFSVE
jgi:hypothetical protein